jgi:hypothetical protein
LLFPFAARAGTPKADLRSRKAPQKPIALLRISTSSGGTKMWMPSARKTAVTMPLKKKVSL